MKSLPNKLKILLLALYGITLGSIFFFKGTYSDLSLNINLIYVVFFAVLMILTETFNVTFRNISVTTSFSIQLASFILFGPFYTIIVAIIGVTFRVFKIKDRYVHTLNTPLYKTLFNYCILTLPIIFGNYAFNYFGGKYSITNISSNIVPIVFYVLIYLITNTSIISILFSILYKKSFLISFFSNIRLAFLNILAMAPFGIILAVVFNTYSYIGVLLVMFPIVLARYTFSLYLVSKSQYVQTVDALMIAMEARDRYTEGHSKRVSKIVEMIAKELKFNQDKIEKLSVASLLHDVGKIGIQDSILNKPGKLTNEEYEIIKQHPVIGYNILKDINNMKEINYIVKYHHERYDGKGYPEGKRGDELPLEVFIVQLADCIDAMATDRPYRSALTEEMILNEITKCDGTQFHPKVVQAYLSATKKQKNSRS
jgi:putative nucleotidyltransferase with HDIG domain